MTSLISKSKISNEIKKKAIELGFDACGISEATFLKDSAIHIKEYLREGMQGNMKYLENNLEKRLDPRKLIVNAKSVISLLLNYFPQTKQNTDSKYKISKYAYGKDYHFVLKDKMKILMNYIKEITEQVNGQYFVDSGQVMDKAWAARSGLGWIGKNTLLINENLGSYFFIGDIVLDLELEYDKKIEEKCGGCRKCIDACPSSAIVKPYVLDGRKCISYQTTSSNFNPSSEKIVARSNWIWGCDICQDICPWNNKLYPTNENNFKINDIIKEFKTKDWDKIEKPIFDRHFSDSPLKQLKFERIKENIQAAKKS